MDRTNMLAAVLAALCCWTAWAQAGSGAGEDEEALRDATHALCRAHLAMVGESATHGDGHTLAFKVALVERLVDQCGFDAVYFEANQEEFFHLNAQLRAGQSVAPEDLLTAVGGLWKFYREFQPLAPFLLARAQSGKLALAGLDDQLGQLGQTYANVEMIRAWSDLLAAPERQRCENALHKRIYSDYTDTAPYATADRSQLQTCLAEIRTATVADKGEDRAGKEERLQMIAATERWIGRDFMPEQDAIVARDRSMYETFAWLQRRAPKPRKVIVWAATVHVAKQGDPAWGDHTGTNFGSLVHRAYGERAYALGFGAVGGSYRQSKGHLPAMPDVPAGAVETRALGGSGADAVFVGAKRLAAVGSAPGAFFRHAYETLPWAEFLDGVVVFRTERPPSDVRDR